jgi:hypothetical protein
MDRSYTVPLPWGPNYTLPIPMDCLNTSITRLPIFLPWWLLDPFELITGTIASGSIYLPTWAADFAANVLDITTNHKYIVPESMVLDDGGCSDIDGFCIPFTDGCKCVPSFENCGERLGFNSPIKTVSYFLNRWFPSIASFRLVRFVAWVTLTSSDLYRYAGINNYPDRCDYDFCFIVTSVGVLWIVLLTPFFLAVLVYNAQTLAALARALAIFTMNVFTFLFVDGDQPIMTNVGLPDEDEDEDGWIGDEMPDESDDEEWRSKTPRILRREGIYNILRENETHATRRRSYVPSAN